MEFGWNRRKPAVPFVGAGTLPARMTSLPSLASPPIVDRLAAASPAQRPAILAAHPTPLRNGGASTFLHLGAADSVAIEHFMARFPSFPPLERVADGLHAVTVHLPERSRVEYKVAATLGGQIRSEVDPHNPHRATDPFGANSVATGPGYREPWWAGPSPEECGTVRRGYVDSAAYGQRRALHWYFPSRRAAGMPVVVVHDGRDFLQHAGLASVLDRLIAAGALPPLIAALVDPVDRLTEYADDPRHARFLGEVTAAAVGRYGAGADAEQHVFVGASLGAVASLAAAWRLGGVGGLALLSGSFVTRLGGPTQRGPMFLPVIDFMARFRQELRSPARVAFQACGEYEGLAPDNRWFAEVLAASVAEAHYRESPDGHHWHHWRDQLGPALALTVPGADRSIAG